MPKSTGDLVNVAPFPEIVSIPITDVPVSASEPNAADREFRDKLALVLGTSDTAAALEFPQREAAENAARRISRLLKPIAPEGMAVRTALSATDASGATRLYIRWGEPRKGGRQPGTTVTPRTKPVTTPE